MGEIDMSVVPLVRMAFGAAVAREPARMTEAIWAMSANHATAHACYQLATHVCAFRLLELYELTPPFDEDLHQLAVRFAEQERHGMAVVFAAGESWAEIDPDDVMMYLQALTLGGMLEKESPRRSGELFRLSFVLGAWLLEAFDRKGMPWWGSFDEIVTALHEADQED